MVMTRWRKKMALTTALMTGKTFSKKSMTLIDCEAKAI